MSTHSTFSDNELLELLKTDDKHAFTELYNRYWRTIYQSCYAILKDEQACDDIVQEIFVWFWANREKHITDNIKPYLFAAAKYKVANLIRHQKVKDVFYSQTIQNYKEAKLDDNSIELKELKEIIAQFTATLPERARMIFHLSRTELLSNKEIAKQLGITEKTVENQMNINLKKLKSSLGKMSFWSTLL